MATVAKDVQAARKGERRRVLMRGTVYSPAGAQSVWIRDISHDGASVAGEDRLPTNCDVIFKRGPIFAAGHVAWSNETGAGNQILSRPRRTRRRLGQPSARQPRRLSRRLASAIWHR